MFVEVPEKLGVQLNLINWDKVSEQEINLLIKFGLPYLKHKGYLKQNKEVTTNEHIKKDS